MAAGRSNKLISYQFQAGRDNMTWELEFNKD